MKKAEMVELIVSKVDRVQAHIIRVYGVSCGVGYDLDVAVTLKNGEVIKISAHALKDSWALTGHLRPNNPYYKYSGSCDRYRERVINYWNEGNGLAEYFGRYTKEQLQYFIDLYPYITEVEKPKRLKRVFSAEKYIEDGKKEGNPKYFIDNNVKAWAKKCDGIEVVDGVVIGLGYLSHPDWEIEVLE